MYFLVANPPRGRPSGGGGVHRTRRIEMIIPSSYLNFLIFMRNYFENSDALWGFTPAIRASRVQLRCITFYPTRVIAPAQCGAVLYYLLKSYRMRGKPQRRGCDLLRLQTHSPTVTPTSGQLTFPVWLQKTPNSGTRFLTGCKPSFLRQNTHFKGRKMYANGRFWMAKPQGGGGVARSRGKEHLF